MSSSDSDWDDDSDDDETVGLGLPAPPGQLSGLPSVPQVNKEPEKPKTQLPAQQIYFAIPVKMFLQTTVVNPRIQLAGAAIIYTLEDTSWKVYFYDQKRLTLIVVDLDPHYASSGKKIEGVCGAMQFCFV